MAAITVPRGSNSHLHLFKNYRTSWQRLPYLVAVITVPRGSDYRTLWQRLPYLVAVITVPRGSKLCCNMLINS
ncbi:MAG: hypothetical protein IPL33_16905 [Sphingobacteriales bacterium]|nr:hypothetical protein [Sphingobacteriales bacterium]